MSDTVLSGIRATGRLHFGNFVGAVQNFVELQKPGNECLYFVADYHTLTTLKDPESLRPNIIAMVKDYLAAGLDPNQSTIYAQSSIPEVCALSWLLGCLQPHHELMGLPTLRDLIKGDPKNLNHGVTSYPVLMAADILSVGASLVPVGEDQVPNVELARDLAKRFNNRFGDDAGTQLVIPRMMADMVRIPGLSGGKMGKSEASEAIDINAPMDEIAAKYRKAVTDPNKQKVGDLYPGNPYEGCQAVYAVHEAITPGEKETRTIANGCLAGTLKCGDCKAQLNQSLSAVLEPFQEARQEWEDRDEEVREILIEGGRKARVKIVATLEMVSEAMGLPRYA